jgi:hypothetical protein
MRVFDREEGVFVFEAAVSFVHAQTRPRHRVEEGFVFEQYFVCGDDDVARVFEAALVEVEATRAPFVLLDEGARRAIAYVHDNVDFG